MGTSGNNEDQHSEHEMLETSNGAYRPSVDHRNPNTPLSSMSSGQIIRMLKDNLKMRYSDLDDQRTREELEQEWTSSLPTYLALYLGKQDVFEWFMQPGSKYKLNRCDAKEKRTCLHWAVLHNRVDIVRALVEYSGKNAREERLNPRIKDRMGMTAYHIAFEQENETVMDILRNQTEFRQYNERLWKDREVYVQVVHAILVAAALTAGVTFSGWLQVPSQAFRNAGMKVFWVTNSVSFFFAVAAMGLSIAILLPTPTIYIGQIVAELHQYIWYTSFSLALSLVSVTFAFASAGFAALLPDGVSEPGYTTIMVVTTAIGGIVCLVTLAYFVLQVTIHYPPTLIPKPRLKILTTSYPRVNRQENSRSEGSMNSASSPSPRPPHANGQAVVEHYR